MNCPGIAFSASRWRDQFFDDSQCDPRVRMRMEDLGVVAARRGRLLIITGIVRTKEKNIEIYGHDEPSGHRRLPSTAIDFMVDRPSPELSLELQNHHEMYMDEGQYYTLMFHDAGVGLHWHLQVPFDKRINKNLYESED